MNKLIAGALTAALIVAACGQSDDDLTSDEALTAPPPPEATKTVAVTPELTNYDVDLSKMLPGSMVPITETERGMQIFGGSETLSSSGKTGGAFLTVSPEFEASASGNTIKVSIRAFAESGSAPLFGSYSTHEVGNSGWRAMEVGPDTSTVSFEYAVPAMLEGLGDYIGLYAPNAPVTIEAVTIEVIG